MSNLKLIYEVYMRTTPEQLWEALTNPKLTIHYDFGSAVESDWKLGSPIVYKTAGGKGSISVQGTVVEHEPQVKLVHTWEEAWNAESREDRPSRVTYAIQSMGTVCRLTVTHDDFASETQTYRMVTSAWPMIISGLKTLLETGEPLGIGG